MKYRFITILHNLNIDQLEHNEIELAINGKISNKKERLKETFNNNLSIGTLGVHSIDEFYNQSFFFFDGSFDENISESQFHERGTRFTFALLRLIQHFVFELWKIKDNNIYVRDGFLFVYNSQLKDGFTFKASLSEITSYSNMNTQKSIFLEKELIQANCIMKDISMEKLFLDSFNYKQSTHDHFFKSSNSERFDRAWYFILNARSASTFPMKIVSFCTALECFFTTGRSELIHRIAERVAILVENEQNKRVETYNLIKKAYDIRSTIVHGSILKGKHEDLEEISFKLDNILRILVSKYYKLFTKKDQDLDDYFLNRLFSKKVD